MGHDSLADQLQLQLAVADTLNLAVLRATGVAPRSQPDCKGTAVLGDVSGVSWCFPRALGTGGEGR